MITKSVQVPLSTLEFFCATKIIIHANTRSTCGAQYMFDKQHMCCILGWRYSKF